ncbi:MAG TPA: glycosyltransferase family 39 protein [Candidatus Sulfomarinibacteraceae bacterium]|nr:glycosyltransferase family 39 protein [Candidatus Sulfomarinibacteraceae bacterium]
MLMHSLSLRIRRLSRPQTSLLIGLLLFVAFLALRLPFRAQFLINWDAVNFALGTEFFDLRHHQPHPPGYIGYIAIGRFLNRFTGDANASLTILSAISGAVAPAVMFALADRFVRRRYAIATALFFGLSPVVWYYSEVALTYSVEMMLALLFVWLGYEARARHSFRALLLSTLFLALLGAIRQSGLAFLLPLWLFFLWPFTRRNQLKAGATFGVANLLWFVPLISFSGGLRAYLDEMADLAGLVVVPTSVVSFRLWGLLQNAVFTAVAFLLAINFGFIILIAARRQRLNPLHKLSPADRRFFYVWVIPALATFVLIHTGQLGYILLVLPAIFLLIGMALSELAEMPAPTGYIPYRFPRPRQALFVVLVSFLAISNTATFFGLQEMVYAFSDSEEANVRQSIDEIQGTLPVLEEKNLEEDNGALVAGTHQFSLRRNDARWSELIELVEQYDSETTAVLTSPAGTIGSFRHLAYYLPDYRVYAIGEDRRQIFGYLFTSYNRSSNYSVDKLKFSHVTLRLPQRVERLIIPDPMIYKHLDAAVPAYTVHQENGRVVVASIPQGTTLSFINPIAVDMRVPDACPPVVPAGFSTNEALTAEPVEPLVETETVITILPDEVSHFRRLLCR